MSWYRLVKMKVLTPESDRARIGAQILDRLGRTFSLWDQVRSVFPVVSEVGHIDNLWVFCFISYRISTLSG